MKKTLVWEILSNLSKKKLRTFNTFLSSPFFNHREDIITLYQNLRSSLLKKLGIPSKEIAFKWIHPTKIYDDKEMRLILSYLHKVLEEFLWIQEVRNTDFEKEKFLITAYRQNNMHRNFDRALKKINKKLTAQPIRNPSHYFTRYNLEHQTYLSLVETGRTKELNLGKVEMYLDYAYLSTKLQQAFLTLSHQAVFDMQYHSGFTEQIMTLAQQESYKKEPPIALYHQFIVLFKEGGIQEFIEFKPFLFQQIQYFTKTEFRGIYLLALNFCIKKVNNNYPAFYAETFDMYKKGVRMGLLLDNGKLTAFSFNNIVGIAIKQDELSWAENFINTNKDYLDQSHKTTTLSLNRARLEFTKKNYKKALSYSRHIDYEDIFNYMTAKILQLKIYYELNETDSLESLIQSLSIFIVRKKKMSYHYKIWKSILFYTQKISTINMYDKQAIEALREKIKTEKILPEREWLLKKLKKINA